MEEENSTLNIINDVKSVFDQLPNTAHGSHAITQMSYNSFGAGQTGFDALKIAFNGLDLSQALESAVLDKKIKRQQKELKDLEKKHTDLTAIIGENIGGKEGSLAQTIVTNLNQEISNLIQNRDELLGEISKKEEQFNLKETVHEELENAWKESFEEKTTKAESDHQDKIKELNKEIEVKSTLFNGLIEGAQSEANKKVKEAEAIANNKVKLINQFSDFLEETNSNMKLYSYVIYGLLIASVLAISFSIPKLLNTFDSYDTFIKSQGLFVSTWHIINYALGILIVKLPWALCLSAVFTGMYKLLKGLLVTYEKINQDKRNMSAIYAISGNVAQSLNEYGMAVAEEEVEDEETEEKFTSIRVEKKGLEQKRESLRWNQIMNYFERMQQTKEEVNAPEDESSNLKSVTESLDKMTDLVAKVVEKFPK